MVNRNRIILLGLVVAGLLAAFFLLLPDRSGGAVLETSLLLPGVDQSGFTRAQAPIELTFPEDDGPHDGFLTEWWYYTGNLNTAEGRPFGYQLTFFRRALSPAAGDPTDDRTSEWRSNQAYSVQFALTDVAGGEFSFTVEFSRGAAGLAGAAADPYRVWLNNFQVA
ncbi:MAG: carotenoid 1,2-hydratase, partial [Anaerolineales bacterium]|nr:carotenoid 1,2-hydratase [Anaerolineales bacterium]